jgi:DMSO reductase anchor subunit
MLFLHLPGRPVAGLMTILCAAVGMMCSARIYIVPARPAWNSRYTIAEFFFTGLLLGPLFVLALDAQALDGWDRIWIARAAVMGGSAQLLTQVLKFLWLARSEQFELRASALLLSRRLQQAFLIRLGLLITAGIVLPLVADSQLAAIVTIVLAAIAEGFGRWLFFVSVVPKSMAAAFTMEGRAA